MAQMPEAIILRKTEETKTGVTYCMADVKTNADHIRAMTDEELATWLGVYCNGQTAQEVGKPCASDMGSCEECWLDWLRQEADKCT